MRYLGKYGWAKIAAVSIGTMVAFFLMFEIWFKVPLPKGPLKPPSGSPEAGTMEEIQAPSSAASTDRRSRGSIALTLMFVGIFLGVIIGVLPGLGGANGVAILLPLTFSMAADLGDHPALVHLLGRALRRRHHLDPFQHPGRAVVGSDHFRRLSAGAEGAGGRGAHRGVHVLVRRRAGRGDPDHVPAAVRREFALRFGPPEFFSVYLLTFCAFVGMGKGTPSRPSPR